MLENEERLERHKAHQAIVVLALSSDLIRSLFTGSSASLSLILPTSITSKFAGGVPARANDASLDTVL